MRPLKMNRLAVPCATASDVNTGMVGDYKGIIISAPSKVQLRLLSQLAALLEVLRTLPAPGPFKGFQLLSALIRPSLARSPKLRLDFIFSTSK